MAADNNDAETDTFNLMFPIIKNEKVEPDDIETKFTLEHFQQIKCFIDDDGEERLIDQYPDLNDDPDATEEDQIDIMVANANLMLERLTFQEVFHDTYWFPDAQTLDAQLGNIPDDLRKFLCDIWASDKFRSRTVVQIIQKGRESFNLDTSCVLDILSRIDKYRGNLIEYDNQEDEEFEKNGDSEVAASSSIENKDTEVAASSSIENKDTEVTASSSIENKDTEVAASSLIENKDTEVTASSSIKNKDTEESTASSTTEESTASSSTEENKESGITASSSETGTSTEKSTASSSPRGIGIDSQFSI